ncbi:MAG: diguanylate cyclase [Pseudomonadota bacterium]
MTFALASDSLDVLCPMHLILDASGTITHAGPTLKKLKAGQPLIGQPFLDVFELRKPRMAGGIEELHEVAGEKLRLRLLSDPDTAFKGVLVRANAPDGSMLINLSFGMSILDGVREFSLTNADFAVTDLALELMYLVEAKTAAMEATSKLNARLQGAKVAAEEQAFTDTLTGLQNRRALDTILQRLIDRKAKFSLMQVDLDYFKAVNDTLGHAAGDHVLKTVGRIMLDETRRGDLVARVGGDEFTIVLNDVIDPKVLSGIGKRLITRLEEPIHFEGHICKISASIGTTQVTAESAGTMRDILADADLALYASKHAGRATQTLYHPGLRAGTDTAAALERRA